MEDMLIRAKRAREIEKLVHTLPLRDRRDEIPDLMTAKHLSHANSTPARIFPPAHIRDGLSIIDQWVQR
jgi:hypothetical protein